VSYDSLNGKLSSNNQTASCSTTNKSCCKIKAQDTCEDEHTVAKKSCCNPNNKESKKGDNPCGKKDCDCTCSQIHALKSQTIFTPFVSTEISVKPFASKAKYHYQGPSLEESSFSIFHPPQLV
jgi:hypothetical protein